jgi:hypothetical protein
MRSDYVTLLLGALMSFAAAYLPLAIVVAITARAGPWLHQPILYYVSAAYFVVLLAFGFRTTLGTGFAPAAGLAALGWVVGAGASFWGTRPVPAATC